MTTEPNQNPTGRGPDAPPAGGGRSYGYGYDGRPSVDYADPPSRPPDPPEPSAAVAVAGLPAPAWAPEAPPPLPPPRARPPDPPPALPGSFMLLPVPDTPPDIRRKLELEVAMHAAPRDPAIRAAYFDHLAVLASGQTGLQTALLPEIAAPLYFRAGTPDVAELTRIFRDQALALPMRATPARILVVGGYVGYAAVDLARRFPRARILVAEPLPDNDRLLTLNTNMWPRIATRRTAIWHHRTRLAPTLRRQADWAVRIHDRDFDDEKTIEAVGIADLLADAGWDGADMVVCDASGAERELFADPTAPWLGSLDVALVALHEGVAPQAAEWVDKALPEDLFAHRRLGTMELYLRRVPRRALPPQPAELPLIRAEPGLARFALADVMAAPFGFFVFDGGNCQLHPNPPGRKPARAFFTLAAAGHTRFEAEVRHAGRYAHPIVFTAAVQRDDGTLAGHAEVTRAWRAGGPLSIDFDPPLAGTVRVILQTAMAPGAPDANNAWAHWLNPRLV